MNFTYILQNVGDPQQQSTLLAAVPHLTTQENEQLIQQVLQVGDQDASQRIRLYFLSASCLDLAGTTLSTKTVQAVQRRLKKLLPPKNVKMADEIVDLAGELALKPLSTLLNSSSTYWGSEHSNCLRALSRIPGLPALLALQSAFQASSSTASPEEGLKYWKTAIDPDAYAQYVLAPLFLKARKKELRLYRVETLTGLQHLTMLESLALEQCTNLQDVTPLASLSHLEILHMPGCKNLVDLSPLASLINIEELNIYGCEKVVSLAPLSALRKLHTIRLRGCRSLNDISGLANKPDLAELSLWGLSKLISIAPLTHTGLKRLHIRDAYKLKDISGLAELAELEYLDLCDCARVADLTALAKLKKVRQIHLVLMPSISDFSPLADMNALEVIKAEAVTPKNIGPWSQLQRLRHITLSEVGGSLIDLQEFGRIPLLEELELAACTHFQSFKGIEQARYLKKLNLSMTENKIAAQDLSPFQGLPDLNELHIKGASCQNLHGLANLPHLERLIIAGFNQLSSLEGLSNLPALHTLGLYDCPIEDMSAIAQLTNLTDLVCHYQIEPGFQYDLRPLVALPHLQELDLSNNKGIKDLTTLKGQATIRKLNLARCIHLQNVTALSEMAALEDLSLSRNQELDWSGLANMASLTKLSLEHTAPADFTFLRNAPKLQTLNISLGAQLVSLDGLEHLHDLRELIIIGNNNLQDIKALATLTKLRHIELSSVFALSDITPLSELTQLETLDISNSDIGNLVPLQQANKLRTLSITRSKVKDLAPLANLANLQEINIAYMCANDIKDVRPLLHLYTLRKVRIGTINNEEKLLGLKELREMSGVEISY